MSPVHRQCPVLIELVSQLHPSHVPLLRSACSQTHVFVSLRPLRPLTFSTVQRYNTPATASAVLQCHSASRVVFIHILCMCKLTYSPYSAHVIIGNATALIRREIIHVFECAYDQLDPDKLLVHITHAGVIAVYRPSGDICDSMASACL